MFLVHTALLLFSSSNVIEVVVLIIFNGYHDIYMLVCLSVVVATADSFLLSECCKRVGPLP
jgi:hypothetical protein